MQRIVIGENERVGKWVAEKVGMVWRGQTSVGLERDGELVAGVVCDHFNGASVHMHVASDESRRWMSRAFLKFCFSWIFEQMGVYKVIGVVESTNTAALEFDKHLGLVEEARIKGAAQDGDLVYLTMTRQQCRWLDEKKGG